MRTEIETVWAAMAKFWHIFGITFKQGRSVADAKVQFTQDTENVTSKEMIQALINATDNPAREC